MKKDLLHSIGLSVLALLAPATCGFAQVAPLGTVDADLVSDSTVQVAPATYTPLTLGQKYTYTFQQVFGPGQILALGFRAGFGELLGRPVYWGGGSDGFAVRMASHFGISLIRQNVAFAVRALDHEDPRYFRLGQGKVWTRAKYAIVHTFLVRKDDGGYMPAYSRFVADVTVPFISREWRPVKYQGTTAALQSGTISLSVASCMNLSREFLPDLRKKFLKR